ncbi:transport protein ComB [Streptococcus pseudoporcinus]|uniref:Transport protein ComB n=1 Tax=Streptococcus pseudoporcinus TaxID=361101 RepID=A0A4U9Z733_9STRE|nr:hypothetical protein [Streptococcus pseudoporcinus]VTS35269.1 transport protein ComB [Streptococcus pseudoporcinus]
MNEDLLESSEYYQKRYHNFSTLIIIPIFSLLIFLGFFFIFMKKEITIKSVGTIKPVKIIEKIQSTSDNLVIKNNLEENRSVKKMTF